MRLVWKRTGRSLGVPSWAVALAATWAALVLAVAVAVRVRGLPPITLCWWKKLTGFPCPTCGGTRAVLEFFDGRPLQALLHNPLLVIALVLSAAWLAVRLVSGWSFSIRFAATHRRLLWILLLILVAANWAYLIARGI